MTKINAIVLCAALTAYAVIMAALADMLIFIWSGLAI
tara:strand:- start:457 stop:567 length:111 start_codon:yes stop_codon:yes gene_type:complete